MRRPLPPLILAFLAARLVFLAVSLEEVVINDELTTGLLWQWLHGARALPVGALLTPYAGGDVLYQILALPLYALLGPSALAVKVLALVVGLAGLVLVASLAQRIGGPRAALYAGLCFALAPPGWLGISLVGTGDHFPSGLLVLLAGHLLLRAVEAEGPRRGRRLFGFGAVVGIALFDDWLFAVAVVALGITALLSRPRTGWRWRDLAGFLGGLALGLLPLVASFAAHGSGVTSMYHRSGTENLQVHAGEVLRRLGSLLGPDLADGAWFPPGLAGRVAAWGWWALVAVALLSAAWRWRRILAGLLPGRERVNPDLEAFLALFVFGFFLAFSLTQFKIEPWRIYGYRYLISIYGAACLLVGVALARQPRWPGLGLGLAWWLPCALALSWPGTPRSPARIADFPGATWTNAAARALDAWQADLGAAFARRVPLIPERERGPFLVSLGSQLRSQGSDRRDNSQLAPRWRVHLRRGLDKDREQVPFPPEAIEDPASWLPQVQGDPGRTEALGRAVVSIVDRSPHRLAAALSRNAGAGDLAPLCTGLGEGVVREHKTPTDLLRWRIPWDDLLAPGCQAAFDRGLSQALAATYAEDPAYLEDALALFGLEAP
ncbi:MAG: glycosyltransferase family 39 protein [Pseudomonadota bacterium]